MDKGAQFQVYMELDEKVRQKKKKDYPTFLNQPSLVVYPEVGRSWIKQRKGGLPTTLYDFTKRLIDILVAGVGLILCLPLMIVISILIMLDSPGPVIFTQQRIGKNRRYHSNGHLRERRNEDLKGTPFYIYKFRTMKSDVNQYASSPGDNRDPRLTRFGRLLRQSCLDELPQLINVLKGDMSLVGPRPEMPFIVQNYNHLEALRLAVKPGVSGLWQLYGSRKKHIHENLHYDLDYISNRSLILDLKIMIKTIGFVFGSKNV